MPQPVAFEHYEVLTRDDGSLHELGRGAMGVTYKAFDTSLRVPVALKVINATYLDNEIARQRFVREAQSAAKLRHRNVATVYHLGTEGDDWFYAMEFIDGETVDALVRRHGPLEPVLALQIAAQVCRALNAAMPHSLVHRDIKPANLMLVREDEELVVKVIDFGLALSVRSDEANEEAGFVGTPHFASPEQLSAQEVDVRSDLYSLGVTLWFMLAANTPFNGTIKQVARQHLTVAPPFDRLHRLPDPVVAVLHKVLEKNPSQRHQTPQEFRRALEDAITQLKGTISAATEPLKIAPAASDLPEPTEESRLAAGTMLASRYKVIAWAGETNTGRAYRCYDREEQRDVKVLILRAEITGAVFTQLEREVEQLLPIAHEHLLRIHELSTVEQMSLVVMEWTEGFTLLELLRSRRQLAASETLMLLQQIAQGVDYALTHGLTQMEFALHQIAVHFPQTIDREKLLRSPLLTWPPFAVKVNPLGTSAEMAASSQTWAGGQTMVPTMPSTITPEGQSHAVQALAAVAYELLGGTTSPLQTTMRISSGGRYTPIATLSEEGNEVLRCALDPKRSFATAGEFYTALKKIEVLTERPLAALAAPSLSLRESEIAAPAQSTIPPATPARLPVKFVGGLLTVLGLGVAIYFLSPRHEHPTVAEATPAPESETIATPVTPPTSTEPETKPTPPAEDLERAKAMRAALTAAEASERASDPEAAIGGWLKAARDFPEAAETVRRRLEFVIDPLRSRPEIRQPEPFAKLQPLLVEAAQLDSVAATLLLAEGLRTTNVKESFAWYSTAAAKGRTEASLQLGLMLANGVEGEPDLERAFYYFSSAAEAGDPAAKNLLAECYLFGKGTGAPPNVERGMKWLREAAEQGNLRAINRLAGCYASEKFGVKTDYAEALRLWARVVETEDPTGEFRQPIGEAHGNLGTLYLSGRGTPQDDARGLELLRKGVSMGDPGSMFYLGVCLVEGSAGLRPDVAEGERLIIRGAEGRHPGAQKWCRQRGLPFTVR